MIYSLLFNVVSKLADIIQMFMQCFYFSLILNRFFKTRICLQVLKYVKVHLLKYLPSWHVTTSWFTFICFNFFLKFRSSHRRCSVKEAVLKNFPTFTRKHLCRDLFLIKLQAWRHVTLLKKGLQHRRFPVNIVIFLKAPILKNISEEMRLKIIAWKMPLIDI